MGNTSGMSRPGISGMSRMMGISGMETHEGGSNIAFDDICLLEHDGDKTGVRALQDHKRNKTCPLQKILNKDANTEEERAGYNKRKMAIEEMHQGLEKIMMDLYGKNPSKEQVLEYGKKWFKNPDVRWEDLLNVHDKYKEGKEAIEAKFRSEDKEWQEVFGKFVLQVDLYDRLSQDNAIGRAAMYRRITNPNDASIKIKDGSSGCETPPWKKAVYIMAPMLLFAIAFSIQSFLLHVATHFYVQYMETGPKSRREGEGMLFDVVAEYVASVVRGFQDVDEGAVTKGRIEFPLWVLDASGIIPAVICACAFFRSFLQGHFHIGLWTKAFIVASIVAVAKGVFDAVTIMPDSIGWEACKARLTDDGLEQMRSVHWRQNFFTTGLWKALVNEVFGVHGGMRVRYCADMMVSGHTYFACVFALSAYKQIHYNNSFFNLGAKNHERVVRFVKIFLGSCVCLEVLLVSLARFHYTVDMLVAIMLVVLLFDSIHVEQWAADWAVGYKWGAGTIAIGNGKERKVLPSNAHELTNFRKFRCFEDFGDDEGDDVENQGPSVVEPKPGNPGGSREPQYSELAQDLTKQ